MSDLDRFATWREIHQQPAVWRGWAKAFDVAAARDWVAAQAVDEVWFCGAGSSAYIGEVLVAALEGRGRFRAVATTDLVARPAAYLDGRRVLVVNFGRSGNSAETVGVLDALDALAPGLPRLSVTCNGASALARRGGRVIVLPEATHDAGFAMTSSFTTMLLTALAVFDPGGDMAALADALQAALPGMVAEAQAARLPERAVFVGSGPCAFIAREAALKVMELAAGQVPALWDSTLGFRHGPKSFVRGATDIWVLGSDEPLAALYDADLVAELRGQFPASRVTHVAAPGLRWGFVLQVVLAQVLAVVWSDRLGLPVDDPFAGQGTLTRVVSGVRLHPVVP